MDILVSIFSFLSLSFQEKIRSVRRGGRKGWKSGSNHSICGLARFFFFFFSRLVFLFRPDCIVLLLLLVADVLLLTVIILASRTRPLSLSVHDSLSLSPPLSLSSIFLALQSAGKANVVDDVRFLSSH